MTDATVMVNELLPDTFNRMGEVVRNDLPKDAAIGVASGLWAFIESTATNTIRNSLNFDVVELLGWGWMTARELHEYKDPNKHPPGENSIVTLGEHKMTTELYPVLTLTIGPMSHKIHFTLELTAQINSVALSIRNGHITGLGTGDCFVEAQLKWRKIPLHNPMQTRKVTLPGHHDFQAPGLEIW